MFTTIAEVEALADSGLQDGLVVAAGELFLEREEGDGVGHIRGEKGKWVNGEEGKWGRGMAIAEWRMGNWE